MSFCLLNWLLNGLNLIQNAALDRMLVIRAGFGRFASNVEMSKNSKKSQSQAQQESNKTNPSLSLTLR